MNVRVDEARGEDKAAAVQDPGIAGTAAADLGDAPSVNEYAGVGLGVTTAAIHERPAFEPERLCVELSLTGCPR